jgi:hypothetical protein
MLEKLPTLLERMRDMLVRFLGTVLAAHVSFLDEGAFEGLSEPTTRGTRRLAGIDLNKARNRHAVDAVDALSTRPNGFTVAQLAEAVRQRSGQDTNMYSARNAAYDLAKLVGKTLVRRIERSRRYAADPPGVRTLCAYVLLREKVIKPAGVVRPCRRPPKVTAPLDHHYADTARAATRLATRIPNPPSSTRPFLRGRSAVRSTTDRLRPTRPERASPPGDRHSVGANAARRSRPSFSRCSSWTRTRPH